MEMKSEVIVHAVKESVGSFEGKAFSSTTFHVEVNLPENNAGRSIGNVTRPFKLGDAKEFDKWAHLGKSLPIRAVATFSVEAARGADGRETTKLAMVALVPVAREAQKAA
jgi:hypothetical protein